MQVVLILDEEKQLSEELGWDVADVANTACMR